MRRKAPARCGSGEKAEMILSEPYLSTFLCYELVQMILDHNNMHNFETFTFFKWFLKSAIAVFILTHTFDLVMGVFSLAQQVVNQSAGIIQGNLDINAAATLDAFRTQLEAMGVWELIGFWIETYIVSFCLQILTIVIFIIVYGRLIEIYLTVSIAPIPLATMANREWGQIGNNYIKALFALAFQGFLIIVCVAIYAVLLRSIPMSDNMNTAGWVTLGFTALLCFGLLKTGGLSKGLFLAH